MKIPFRPTFNEHLERILLVLLVLALVCADIAVFASPEPKRKSAPEQEAQDAPKIRVIAVPARAEVSNLSEMTVVGYSGKLKYSHTFVCECAEVVASPVSVESLL